MGRMRRTFALVFALLFALAVTIPATAAASRATNKVDMAIPPNSILRTDTPLSMEVGELVTINCTYSPRMADVDFGLITPRNTFIYVEGKNGNCNQTIRINETGRYYFAVYNNSGETVEVSGYVYY